MPSRNENLETAAEFAANGCAVYVLPRTHQPPLCGFDLNPHLDTAAAPPREILEAEPESHLALATGTIVDVLAVDLVYGGEETLDDIWHLVLAYLAQSETGLGAHHVFVPASGARNFQGGGITYLGQGGLVYLPHMESSAHIHAHSEWSMFPNFDEPVFEGSTQLRDGLVSGFAATDLPLDFELPKHQGPFEREDHQHIDPWMLEQITSHGWNVSECDEVLALTRSARRAGRVLNNPQHSQRLEVVGALLQRAHRCGLVARFGLDECLRVIRRGLNLGFGGDYYRGELLGDLLGHLAIAPLSPCDENESSVETDAARTARIARSREIDDQEERQVDVA